MARINLLPWREEQRELRKKEFQTMLVASGLVGLLCAFLVYTFYNGILDDQRSANESIKNELTRLDANLKSLDGIDVKREELRDRIDAVYALQGNRPVVVHLFDELTRSIPLGLYLDRFERKGDTFFIEGKAESPAVVSEFMRNLELSPWYRNVFMSGFEQKVTDAPVSSATTAVSGGVTGSSVGSNVTSNPEDSYGSFKVKADLDTPKLSDQVPAMPAMPTTAGAVGVSPAIDVQSVPSAPVIQGAP